MRWRVTSDSRDRYRVSGTAEGWFGPRRVRRTVTGRQAATWETAWPYRRGVRDAPGDVLSDGSAPGKRPLATSWHMARLPCNDVQITHLGTVTARWGA